MLIFCVKCGKNVTAFLQKDEKYYWVCPHCQNHAICFMNTKRPLGYINTKEIKQKIIEISELIKSKGLSYRECFMKLSNKFGYRIRLHEVKSIKECENIIEFIKGIT